jgi:hypothetical protein
VRRAAIEALGRFGPETRSTLEEILAGGSPVYARFTPDFSAVIFILFNGTSHLQRFSFCICSHTYHKYLLTTMGSQGDM